MKYKYSQKEEIQIRLEKEGHVGEDWREQGHKWSAAIKDTTLLSQKNTRKIHNVSKFRGEINLDSQTHFGFLGSPAHFCALPSLGSPVKSKQGVTGLLPPAPSFSNFQTSVNSRMFRHLKSLHTTFLPDLVPNLRACHPAVVYVYSELHGGAFL